MEFETLPCGCPAIVDEDWDLTERDADETVFFSQPLWMLFHIPLGRKRARQKLGEALAKFGLKEAEPRIEMLKDGLFRGAVMVAVKERIPESEKGLITWQDSKLISKVVSGNRRETSAAVSGLLSYIRSKTGRHPKEVYFWRVDCESCGDKASPRTVIIAAL